MEMVLVDGAVDAERQSGSVPREFHDAGMYVTAVYHVVRESALIFPPEVTSSTTTVNKQF